MATPDSPTQTIYVDQLVRGDQVLVLGEIETVTRQRGGFVWTNRTGPDSAYMWAECDQIDIVSRATS